MCIRDSYSTVTLVGDTTLVADGGEFSREIIGNGQDLTLNINNTITIEDGSGVKNLTSSGETILTGTINTTGSQAYQSNVTIEGNVELNAVGDVSFSAEVSGNQNEPTVNLTSSSTRRQIQPLVAQSRTWQHSPLMRAAQLLQRPTSPPQVTRPTTISLCSTPA